VETANSSAGVLSVNLLRGSDEKTPLLVECGTVALPGEFAAAPRSVDKKGLIVSFAVMLLSIPAAVGG